MMPRFSNKRPVFETLNTSYDKGKTLDKPHAKEGEGLNQMVDIQQYLVQRPFSTYYFEMKESGFEQEGIFEGDLLVVDSKISVRDGDLILCQLDGEYGVRRWTAKNGNPQLSFDNPDFSPVSLDAASNFKLCGVVKGLARRM